MSRDNAPDGRQTGPEPALEALRSKYLVIMHFPLAPYCIDLPPNCSNISYHPNTDLHDCY